MCKNTVKNLPFIIRYVSDWYKDIFENGGTLQSVPNCYKNQQICDINQQILDNYLQVLKCVAKCYKAQKTCDEAVDKCPFVFDSVPDQYIKIVSN